MQRFMGGYESQAGHYFILSLETSRDSDGNRVWTYRAHPEGYQDVIDAQASSDISAQDALEELSELLEAIAA